MVPTSGEARCIRAYPRLATARSLRLRRPGPATASSNRGANRSCCRAARRPRAHRASLPAASRTSTSATAAGSTSNSFSRSPLHSCVRPSLPRRRARHDVARRALPSRPTAPAVRRAVTDAWRSVRTPLVAGTARISGVVWKTARHREVIAMDGRPGLGTTATRCGSRGAIAWSHRASGATSLRPVVVQSRGYPSCSSASRRDAQYLRIRSATALRCSSLIVRFRFATGLEVFFLPRPPTGGAVPSIASMAR